MSSTALFRTEAEIARRRIERSGPIPVDTSLGAISLRITDDLPSLEAVWEELQATAPCTAAQTYDWAQGLGAPCAWARGPRARHRRGLRRPTGKPSSCGRSRWRQAPE